MQLPASVELRRPLAEPAGGDAHLQHALEREVRSGQERAVLVLHLAKLLAPGPRPHHRRIAKAILDDTAQALGGQVFARGNADVVLLCPLAGAARVEDTLTRLFHLDTPPGDALISLWTLPQDSVVLETYLSRTAAHTIPLEEPSAAPAVIGAMESLIGTVRLTDLIRRQMAVQITPGGMIPIYRELSFSMEALDARVNTGGSAQGDPYLFRHLAGRLDRRMLDLLAQELGRPGMLPPTPTLHLNLTVRAVLSMGFLRFIEAAEAASARVGVEVSLMDACADPLAFGAARMALRAHGCTVVLDTIPHQAMLISQPEALDPDLVKLDWAPRMAKLAPEEHRMLASAIARVGPKRVVLHRAETEAALAWGKEHGITRFQGRHVDAMLAAGRLSDCPHAGGCTLRQCVERAAATGSAGRSGCRNTERLDSADIAMASPA